MPSFFPDPSDSSHPDDVSTPVDAAGNRADIAIGLADEGDGLEADGSLTASVRPVIATDPSMSDTVIENGDLSPSTDIASDGTPAEPEFCPRCQMSRHASDVFCIDCGFVFASAQDATDPAFLSHSPMSGGLLNGRYRLSEMIRDRGLTQRFRGIDLNARDDTPVPVVLIRQAIPADPISQTDESMLLGADDETPEALPASPFGACRWPSLDWERLVLERARHISLPGVIDHFDENGYLWLVVEIPGGVGIREAWNDRTVTARERYAWLIEIAEALDKLHQAGAILDGLRPDLLSITPTGHCVIVDVADLLPMPMSPDVPLSESAYTAPELILNPASADARADLYSFGATVYSLHLGRDLTEMDFTLQGVPRPFLDRFADAHPLVGRLISKTFCFRPEDRFPSSYAEDQTGIVELTRNLEACRRNIDRVRLDISSWTTTGILRTGNEDALAVVHGSESCADDTDEFALIALADGMGGMEGGEIAAAVSIQAVRHYLLACPPFSGVHLPAATAPNPIRLTDRLCGGAGSGFMPRPGVLSGDRTPPPLMNAPLERDCAARAVYAHQDRLLTAIHQANDRVHEAATSGLGNRGMGCTLEVVVIDGPQVMIGHVGDSRTYHMHQGRLTQITMDQTLVAWLVETGQITAEQAEVHPRRNELQQAIGGRDVVYPDIYPLTLSPGDWLLICSDGLSNTLHSSTLEAVLRESHSSERAARRLVNLANLEGAGDNVTVIVVRAM